MTQSGAYLLLNVYTKHSHELRHARKAWPATLIGPCILTGSKYKDDITDDSYSQRVARATDKDASCREARAACYDFWVSAR